LNFPPIHPQSKRGEQAKIARFGTKYLALLCSNLDFERPGSPPDIWWPDTTKILADGIKRSLGDRKSLFTRFTEEHLQVLLDQAIYDEGDLERVSAKDLKDCGLPIGLVALLKPDKGMHSAQGHE